MTKQEFDKRYVDDGIVTRCPTKALAMKFLKLADKFGYKWCTNRSYIDMTQWDDYKERTVYRIIEGRFGDTSCWSNRPRVTFNVKLNNKTKKYK